MSTETDGQREMVFLSFDFHTGARSASAGRLINFLIGPSVKLVDVASESIGRNRLCHGPSDDLFFEMRDFNPCRDAGKMRELPCGTKLDVACFDD